MAGPLSRPVGRANPVRARVSGSFKVILQSLGYGQRLMNHYRLFRAAVEEECASRNGTQRDLAGRRSTRRQGAKKSG